MTTYNGLSTIQGGERFKEPWANHKTRSLSQFEFDGRLSARSLTACLFSQKIIFPP